MYICTIDMYMYAYMGIMYMYIKAAIHAGLPHACPAMTINKVSHRRKRNPRPSTPET